MIRAGYGSSIKKKKLILLHSLTNFEIEKYYQNEPRFHGTYSRNNLPEIKDDSYVINLGEYESIESHWIVLHVNGDNVTYFDSFGVEHNPKEIKKFIRNKNITTNILRIQAYDSIMCIGFIDCMLKSKSLLEYTNLFLANQYERND